MGCGTRSGQLTVSSSPASSVRRDVLRILRFSLWMTTLLVGPWSPSCVAVASPALSGPSETPPVLSEQCTNDQYQRCLSSLESVTKGEDITLVTSKPELHHVCRKLKRVVDCVDKHTAQCFDAALQRLFNQVVAGAKETIAEVCLPGDTQDDFLRHARCNRKVTMDETKCAPAYRRTLELAKTVSQTQDVDRGLRRSCCAFSEFVECKSFHVSRDCGDRASEFFARHMERISGPLIEDHCGPYAHGACVSAATDAATPATMRGSYGTFSTILLVLTSVVYTAGYPCPKNSWGSWP